MRSTTLPYAACAGGLVGSVIDSSTSLLHKQTHDVVRFAIDNGVNTTELFDTALAEGVAYIPGAAFSPSGRFTDALRVCFASTPPDRIHEGVARLRRAVDDIATS